MKIIFVGPPGAGKGTQAKLLAQKLKIPHISTGDMLRNSDENTEFGKKIKQVKEIMNRGELVPDAIMVKLVNERISQPDCNDGFILDGFPRSINQAEELDKIMAAAKKSLDAVVAVMVEDKILEQRVADRAAIEGRKDDNPDAFRQRLTTEPVLAYYKKRAILRAVDGSKTIEEVTASIDQVLGSQTGDSQKVAKTSSK
jgi:adenylate kinase